MTNRALSLQSPLVYTSDKWSLQPALEGQAHLCIGKRKKTMLQFNHTMKYPYKIQWKSTTEDVKSSDNFPYFTFTKGNSVIPRSILRATSFPNFSFKGQFKLPKLSQRSFKLKERTKIIPFTHFYLGFISFLCARLPDF